MRNNFFVHSMAVSQYSVHVINFINFSMELIAMAWPEVKHWKVYMYVNLYLILFSDLLQNIIQYNHRKFNHTIQCSVTNVTSTRTVARLWRDKNNWNRTIICTYDIVWRLTFTNSISYLFCNSIYNIQWNAMNVTTNSRTVARLWRDQNLKTKKYHCKLI